MGRRTIGQAAVVMPGVVILGLLAGVLLMQVWQ